MKGWKGMKEGRVAAARKVTEVMRNVSGEAVCLDCDWKGKGSIADAAGRSVQHCVNNRHRVAVRVGTEYYMNYPYDPTENPKGFESDGVKETAAIKDMEPVEEDDGTIEGAGGDA